jgi:hypothetical protein
MVRFCRHDLARRTLPPPLML